MGPWVWQLYFVFCPTRSPVLDGLFLHCLVVALPQERNRLGLDFHDSGRLDDLRAHSEALSLRDSNQEGPENTVFASLPALPK